MRNLRIVAMFVAVLVMLVAQSVDAELSIQIRQGKRGRDAFFPRTTTLELGSIIHWTSADGRAHNIRLDNGGDFAVPAGGDSVPGALNVASTYVYRCTFHKAKKGVIGVPMEITDASVPQGVDVTYTWASAPLEPGYDVDVQARFLTAPSKKLRKRWLDLSVNKTTQSYSTVGDLGWDLLPQGNYLLRARFQHTASGTTFGYSPPIQFQIT